jgi:hypothetical protein
VTRCSDQSAAAGEQLAGSAPHAVAWLALEQSGPWGAKAFTASHLDPQLGRAVEEAAAAHVIRPVLIRRPGPHADPPVTDLNDPRQLLVASTVPGRSWLLRGTLQAPEQVLDLDWAALEAGDQGAVRRSLPALEPTAAVHLLVCTNGRRDVCCASKGRPVALALADRHPGRVWEVTHTSGHRFAATAVLLPAGTLHGRLDVAATEDLLAAADRGETVVAGSRGRSTWPPPAQVAELAVREATGETGLDSVAVADHVALGEHEWRSVVRHRDGRAWAVTVRSDASEAFRSESCGKAALPLRRYHVSVAPAR